MMRLLGIIGYPLGHSLSPAFQQAALDACGLDARYELWGTPLEGIPQRLRELRDAQALGASVTIPYKETVKPFLDRLAESARGIGAVNTIVNRAGMLEGHNTDAAGFLRALREQGADNAAKQAVHEQGGVGLGEKKVLLLGAGGAARAVAWALIKERVASLTIANRTVERARQLASSLSRWQRTKMTVTSLEPEALASHQGWDLIVNATSLGMRHTPVERLSPIPAGLIPAHALVYDLVYNPAETPLLREAKRAGARTVGGLPMLVYQGAEAFRLWTGQEAPIDVMLRAARAALEKTPSEAR